MGQPRRYVVTGGGGFVGKALCKALRAAGHDVISLSRKVYPDLEAAGVKTAQVDISSSVDAWHHLFVGCDGVFHTAAKVDMWGRYRDFYATNVVGTRNIVEACRRSGVKQLVFTSSPSVIHTGRDLLGVNESVPYPEHFHAYYPETKAQAEREVLSANGNDGLRTVALRPHLIWGPNDTNFIPTIIERARAGKLTRIGDGHNRVDLTFIEDCVQAHIVAMRTLEEAPDRAAGKAYFISQGDPVEMWPWIDQVLAAQGLPPVQRAVSVLLARVLALIFEGAAKLALIFGFQSKPLLTRFLVSEMATSHYFDISAAQRDLGYSPSVTIDQAMVKTFGSGAAAIQLDHPALNPR
jgi:nucleoside-diphosphate-sugar epimerase